MTSGQNIEIGGLIRLARFDGAQGLLKISKHFHTFYDVIVIRDTIFACVEPINYTYFQIRSRSFTKFGEISNAFLQ